MEYDLPHVGGAAAGDRISTLLDNVQEIHYARLREAIVQSLVSSLWQEHPDAVMIRVVFGVANLPTAEEFRTGQKGSYHSLSTYDFRLGSESYAAAIAVGSVTTRLFYRHVIPNEAWRI